MLFNCIFFVFKISLLPNYRVKYNFIVITVCPPDNAVVGYHDAEPRCN